MEKKAMTTHATGTRKEWMAARLELLKAEKEHTRRGDELALRRQQLPWVRIDKDYRFETDEGKASLADLFRGRSQLLVYHMMFGPNYTAACPSCSAIADGFNGFHIHLVNHDVMLWAVSRAPLAQLHAYKSRMGWTFPWASSHGSDFNADYSVGFTKEEQQREGGIEYNYRREDALKRSSSSDQNVWGTGVDLATYLRERPGVSSTEALSSAYQSVNSVGAFELTQKNPISIGETLEGQPGVAKRSFGPGAGRPVI